jgi:hypothetical protein
MPIVDEIHTEGDALYSYFWNYAVIHSNTWEFFTLDADILYNKCQKMKPFLYRTITSSTERRAPENESRHHAILADKKDHDRSAGSRSRNERKVSDRPIGKRTHHRRSRSRSGTKNGHNSRTKSSRQQRPHSSDASGDERNRSPSPSSRLTGLQSVDKTIKSTEPSNNKLFALGKSALPFIPGLVNSTLNKIGLSFQLDIPTLRVHPKVPAKVGIIIQVEVAGQACLGKDTEVRHIGRRQENPAGVLDLDKISLTEVAVRVLPRKRGTTLRTKR